MFSDSHPSLSLSLSTTSSHQYSVFARFRSFSLSHSFMTAVDKQPGCSSCSCCTKQVLFNIQTRLWSQFFAAMKVGHRGPKQIKSLHLYMSASGMASSLVEEDEQLDRPIVKHVALYVMYNFCVFVINTSA